MIRWSIIIFKKEVFKNEIGSGTSDLEQSLYNDVNFHQHKHRITFKNIFWRKLFSFSIILAKNAFFDELSMIRYYINDQL